MLTKMHGRKQNTHTDPHPSSRKGKGVGTWDVVDLPTVVMLQSVTAAVAAASTAATMLGTGHAHEAAGHRELGGLGKVGQDPSCRVRQPLLQGGLRLGSLRTRDLLVIA